jgi:hypothetical protein
MDIFLLDHGTSGDVFHCPFEQNWTVLVNCLDLGCTYALVLVLAVVWENECWRK